ncbi:rubredoxin-like domain-containing protein [Desulforhopalus singaporensis]|uniref:Rubredoxin-like domain-containing protein n=1 Tax=Desulforhopalus singaporensis TaxID=91360 RepID=A0A1H0J0J7_9BACT|nr:DUF2231 domain-containing protein [Desulforhopalus singaporensis]SDO36881.1 hypothetical protein SAMN05660330_00090 [Desulforhopalus singaporensis]
MSHWECGVCGYVHKEEKPPEACPVCEAPEKMFTEKPAEPQQVEPQQANDSGTTAVTTNRSEPADPPKQVKTWRCTVSGYLHTGVEPPEKCPICEATADQFEEVTDTDSHLPVAQTEKETAARWKCTVCGYIHEGDAPPAKCPVCAAPASMFVPIDEEGNDLAEPPKVAVEPISLPIGGKKKKKIGTRILGWLASLSLKLHLHPISAHFPNGILPAVVIFLLMAVFLENAVLGTVAYCNLIFTLIMLPPVLLTGYLEWQKRYKGIKSAIFITKITCAVIVLFCVNILVFWRVIDPQVLAPESPYQLVYLATSGVMIAAAAIAGHLGGKLVFGTRNSQ